MTIHTIGVGDDQDEDFLCQLATQNNGVYIKNSVETCRAEPKPAAVSVVSSTPEPETQELETLEPEIPELETVQSKSYTDAQGRTIHLSHGDLSFADAVVSFEMGQPAASGDFANPDLVLGNPDYDTSTGEGATTLGCGGILVVQFTDNALIDIDGPDLHVFEVGPQVEPIQVAISRDGDAWIDLGTVSGGQASFDIASFAEPDEAYYFVKLIDAKSACSGDWPGAGLDAVAAMGTGERISLRSAILFDFDKFDLKPEAREELDRVAARIQAYPNAHLVISGHTDSDGSIEYNQELSEKRAISFQEYLASFVGTDQYSMQTRGYGELRPVATNDTEEGREQNRRVEILILPAATISTSGL